MELGYYLVDGEYGWDQEKFTDLIMKKGGCGAVAGDVGGVVGDG